MVQWLKRAAHNGCNVGSNPTKPILIDSNLAINLPLNISYIDVRIHFIINEYHTIRVAQKRALNDDMVIVIIIYVRIIDLLAQSIRMYTKLYQWLDNIMANVLDCKSCNGGSSPPLT